MKRMMTAATSAVWRGYVSLQLMSDDFDISEIVRIMTPRSLKDLETTAKANFMYSLSRKGFALNADGKVTVEPISYYDGADTIEMRDEEHFCVFLASGAQKVKVRFTAHLGDSAERVSRAKTAREEGQEVHQATKRYNAMSTAEVNRRLLRSLALGLDVEVDVLQVLEGPMRRRIMVPRAAEEIQAELPFVVLVEEYAVVRGCCGATFNMPPSKPTSPDTFL